MNHDNPDDHSAPAFGFPGPAALAAALDAAPLDPALHRALAGARRDAGDELGALAHEIAAQTLDEHAARPASAIELCNVATGYFMKGEGATALRWYRLALLVNPALAIAWQNMASIHDEAGRGAAAADCRGRAYRIQRVFVEQSGTPRHRVLILCVGGGRGNIPFDNLLPFPAFARVKYAIDYAAEEEDARLPAYDLVFNAIGEPDAVEQLEGRLQRFAARERRPLLNSPEAVLRTARDRIAALLADVDGVVTAPCVRLEQAPADEQALAQRLAAAGLELPLLARPAATHGGIGLALHDSMPALFDALRAASGAHFVTAFRDYVSADGFYRKYRAIFIDRRPFPYHLAISRQWMVHYFSADMLADPRRIEEEERFLRDPEAALGARAMVALRAIGERIDLDYAGIDFTLLPDGRLFVFEANATMLAHFERAGGPLAHKNAYVARIVEAFAAMIARRTA